MKERILSKWTLSRALYLFMGVMILVQSAMSHQWLGVAFGGYFASMGLFAFGCASGNCFGGSCEVDPKQKSNTAIQDVDFEEVEAK